MEEPLPKHYGLERLILLSDGVFAISMTLLALELRAPENWDGTVGGLIGRMHGALVAHAISFMVVAVYWMSHRRTFRSIRKTDGPLTLLSLFALGLITLLPAMTRLLIEHPEGRDALLLYLGLIAAMGVASAVVWGYAAVRPGLMDPAESRRYRVVHFIMLAAVPVATTSLVILGASGAGVWAWILVAAMFPLIAVVRRWAMKPAKPPVQKA